MFVKKRFLSAPNQPAENNQIKQLMALLSFGISTPLVIKEGDILKKRSSLLFRGGV